MDFTFVFIVKKFFIIQKKDIVWNVLLFLLSLIGFNYLINSKVKILLNKTFKHFYYVLNK